MSALRAAMSNREIARLAVSWAGVALVRWALTILIGLYAFRSGGAGAVGGAAFVRMVPAAIVAPRLALTADRWSRRRVLLVSTLARLLLAGALTATVGAAGSLVVVLALATIYGAVDSVQRPAQAALLPVWARDPAELAAANALCSMLDNAGFLVGSLLVGLLVAALGLTAGFAMCVVPLTLATAALLGLARDSAPPPLQRPRLWPDLLAGAVAVAREQRLRVIVGLRTADMFVQAMTDVLLVVIAIGALRLGGQGAGWLSAAWGAGGIVGGGVASTLLARRRLVSGISWGLLLAGAPLVAIGAWPQPGFALAVLVGLGIGYGLVDVGQLTLGQRLVPADVLGRVYGLEETLGIAAMAVGSLAASALVEGLGQRGALVLTGALLPALAFALHRQIRRLGAGARADAAVFELLRRVPAFAALPVATVESLAVRAARVTIPAGEDVVRQGDHGDTFYVIERGRLEISEGDTARRTQSRGDYFGEIALLHDVPRTATVHAATAVTLLALTRDEFLAAIGSHPRAAHEMQVVAEDRLAPATPAAGGASA